MGIKVIIFGAVIALIFGLMSLVNPSLSFLRTLAIVGTPILLLLFFQWKQRKQ